MKDKIDENYFNKVKRYFSVLFKAKEYKKKIKHELSLRLECEPTKKQINWCFRDYLHFNAKYKGTLETDYFGTNIYLKSDFIRQESFATLRRNKWRDNIQDKNCWEIFLNKERFYQNFSKYLFRKYMVVNCNTDLEEIKKFVKKCSNKVISKTVSGFGGNGILFWDCTNPKKVDELYNYAQKNNPIVIEEILNQTKEMHVFSNYGSVNTVRIITIIDETGKPHIASAVFRIGRQSSTVDNYSSGGMAAPIDVETGIIFRPAINKIGKEFIVHPDSQKQIVGFKIPDWENYKKFALKLAKKFPTMRYVGWDIIKNTNGDFVIIEGNKDAGVDCLEAGLLYGMLPIYNKILNNKK